MPVPGLKSVEECPQYLNGLGVSDMLSRYGKALFRPLSEELVYEGLKKLQCGGLPALDGVQSSILKAFSSVFVPKMLGSIKDFLEVGEVPKSWTDGIVTHIPKDSGMPVVMRLRPIALQTRRQKWLTNTIMLQLNDLLMHDAVCTYATSWVYTGAYNF